jgi:prevent-host-death family protein
MSIVTIHEARTDLSKLLRKVAAGEEVIIARGRKSVARLVGLGEVKGNVSRGRSRRLCAWVRNSSSLCPKTSCLRE